MLARFVMGAGLASIVALLAIYDYLAAATLEWQALAVAFLLAGVVQIPGTREKRTARMLLFGLFLGTLAVLRFVELSPVKPFRSLYHDLRPGLSIAEVDGCIERHFSPNGRYRMPDRRRLDDGSVLLILDPDDGRYNSTTLHLAFRDGRLVASSYSAD